MSWKNKLKKFLFFDEKKLHFLTFFAFWGVASFVFFLIGLVLGWFMGRGPVKTAPVGPLITIDKKRSQEGQMVSLGEGYFLVQQKSHYLLAERKKGGELRILRVYELNRDLKRYPQDPEKIALHNYYFDDITRSKERKLAQLKERFRELKKPAMYLEKYNREAKEIAEEIARLGAVKFLMPYLSSDSYPRHRKAVALALGKRGYKKAIPPLLEFLEEKDLPLRRKIVEIFSSFTKEQLYTEDQKIDVEEVKKKMKKWLREQKK